jgi:hypothetical protein
VLSAAFDFAFSYFLIFLFSYFLFPLFSYFLFPLFSYFIWPFVFLRSCSGTTATTVTEDKPAVQQANGLTVPAPSISGSTLSCAAVTTLAFIAVGSALGFLHF